MLYVGVVLEFILSLCQTLEFFWGVNVLFNFCCYFFWSSGSDSPFFLDKILLVEHVFTLIRLESFFKIFIVSVSFLYTTFYPHVPSTFLICGFCRIDHFSLLVAFQRELSVLLSFVSSIR